jgi:hypothetical protein
MELTSDGSTVLFSVVGLTEGATEASGKKAVPMATE